jgi:hypothetical protein
MRITLLPGATQNKNQTHEQRHLKNITLFLIFVKKKWPSFCAT